MPNNFYIKNDAIIVDIDGTLTKDSLLIDIGDVNPREDRDFYLKKYSWYNQNVPPCSTVPLREPVVEIVKREMRRGVIPFFVTAREDAIDATNGSTRKNTLDYLRFIFSGLTIAEEQLLMRTYNDFSPNYEVKEEIYNKYIKGRYNVLYCLEDEEKNVEMFRKNGLLVLQIHEVI